MYLDGLDRTMLLYQLKTILGRPSFSQLIFLLDAPTHCSHYKGNSARKYSPNTICFMLIVDP